MPPQHAAKFGRAVFTILWAALALGAVYYKAPRFWDTSSPVAEAKRAIGAGDVETAAVAVQRALVAEPRNPDLLVLIGSLEQRRGRLAEAASAYQQSLAIRPGSVEATLGLAETLIDQQDAAKAVALLAPLGDQLPADQQRRRLGLIALAGDPVAVDQAATAVLARQPNDTIALGHALNAAEERERWPEAATLARRLAAALHDADDHRVALLRAARAEELSGRPREALALYTEAGGDETRETRAKLALESGDIEGAVALTSNIASLPDTGRHGDVAYALQRAGRRSEALAVYHTGLTSDDLNLDARLRYAWMLNESRAYEQAWAVSAPLTDRSRRVLELRARTAAWAGKTDAAASLLNAWLAVEPRDTVAWSLLAEVQRKRGETDARRASLARLLGLLPGNAAVRRTIADELAWAGDLDSAAAHYRALADRHGDPQAIAQLALLFEQRGRLAEAIAAWRDADSRRPLDGPSQLRLARLLRWSGDPVAAERAYRAHLAAGTPDASAEGELGITLVETQQYGEALERLDRALAQAPSDLSLLVAAAQAAARSQQPARAVGYLKTLAANRTLSMNESRWLAGELDAAGDVPSALEAYRTVVATGGADAQTWERIGDLEALRERPADALTAYARIDEAGQTPALWRKVARTAHAAGRPSVAADAYARALAATPTDLPLVLEAARYDASIGEPSRALTLYDRYFEAKGSEQGLHLELARTALAASRPADALRWSMRALDLGDQRPEIQYARAQALLMTGKPREAADVFRMLLATEPANGNYLGWLARTAQARGRDLEAFELFGAALDRQATPAAGLLVARGDAAAHVGDVGRAERNYTRALAAGAEPALVRDRQRDLSGRTTTQVGAPAELFSDSTGVEIRQAGGQFLTWPAGSAKLTGGWSAGDVRQHATTLTSQAVGLRLTDLFVTPRLALGGNAGVQRYAGQALATWGARARYATPAGRTVAVDAFRESPWAPAVDGGAMRFNRMSDLASVSPTFHSTGAHVAASTPLSDRTAISGDVDVRRFSDGNRQASLYLQGQRAWSRTSGANSTWVAVQPHVYVEGWSDRATAYFSPSTYTATGVTLRAIVERGGWSFDGSVAPQGLFEQGRSGVGLLATGSGRVRVGSASIGAGVMLFDDRRHDYQVTRVTADVRIPVGGR